MAAGEAGCWPGQLLQSRGKRTLGRAADVPVDVADKHERGAEADGAQHEEEGPAHDAHVAEENCGSAVPQAASM